MLAGGPLADSHSRCHIPLIFAFLMRLPVPSASAAHPARWYIALLACLLVFVAPGCSMFLPDVSHEPNFHNPFPQLSRVAVAPFFNQSDEATLDARRFSMEYFGQLQAIPGFEVVPLGVVEEAINRHAVDLSSPGEARRLAEILGVDVVVVGSITDYSPYTPPRCGMRVEWYARNPGFHQIPPGYGLPWGTPEEEFIPPPLAYEAEMALARARLAAQTPDCRGGDQLLPLPPLPPNTAVERPALSEPEANQQLEGQPDPFEEENAEALPVPPSQESPDVNPETPVAYQRALDSEPVESDLEELPLGPPLNGSPGMTGTVAPKPLADATLPNGLLPPEWSMGDDCLSPCRVRPPCIVHHGPIMTHTRIYHGDSATFAEALAGYVRTRNDDRFGGWQTYLQRSDDFIRFCCHLHITEMLTARGGAGETQVVCEWPVSR